jgi:catechol 2,3-dioxygenase-like lactoylglutathione lyase family enzyme
MSGVRLALVIVAVEDLPRSLAFYRTVTMWAVPVETPVYAELLSPNGFRLGLYDRRGFGRNIGRVPEPIAGPVATTELYLYVDDIAASMTRARDAGASLLDDPSDRPWGDHVGYMSDPDGYVVAFARPA